jgi:hypothetical protein
MYVLRYIVGTFGLCMTAADITYHVDVSRWSLISSSTPKKTYPGMCVRQYGLFAHV